MAPELQAFVSSLAILQNKHTPVARMHNKFKMYVYTMKNFIVEVAFHVDCTGSQVGMTKNKNYQYLYTSVNRRINSQNFHKIIHESSVNCATTAIGN